MKNELKLYAKRDRRKLGRQFALHMTAMTAESLEQKGDISAELAHRDAEIDRLRKAMDASIRAEIRTALDYTGEEVSYLVFVVDGKSMPYLHIPE